ncbi:hypothetical protein [Granulicella sp. dw_53]|uniref:hypothetical protein n=1 Tax=Granulicella sp. dw_53 TaxID=2719792 RepID=UPI001BD5BB87|nr:hypothetical protein [Granulicella sp. dw_53]
MDFDFMKLFLRAVALVPDVIHRTEARFGEKTGVQKREAAVEIVGAAIDVANAVSLKHIADSGRFTEGLGRIIDGVVECLNASVWMKS